MPLNVRDVQLAHLLLRLLLGVNILIHGLVRMPKLQTFAEATAAGFAETWMPVAAARPFAYLIPFAEVIIGGLMVLGLLTRQALAAGGCFMILLTIGVCLQERWDVAGLQLTYGIAFFILLATATFNRWSLDEVTRGRPHA